MVEPLMYSALGFSLASLVFMMLVVPLKARAARLAQSAVETRLPLSMSEIAARHDMLRAEHALACRRLERDMACMRESMTHAHARLEKKDAIIARLKSRIVRLLEQDAAATAPVVTLRDTSARTVEITRLRDAHAAIMALQARLENERATTDSLRAELAAASAATPVHDDAEWAVPMADNDVDIVPPAATLPGRITRTISASPLTFRVKTMQFRRKRSGANGKARLRGPLHVYTEGENAQAMMAEGGRPPLQNG